LHAHNNFFVPLRSYSHVHGNVLHAYALQFLLPLCITAILLLIKQEHGCTWINRALPAQNVAFLMVIPLISSPNVQFNPSSVVMEKPKWADGTTLSYKLNLMVHCAGPKCIFYIIKKCTLNEFSHIWWSLNSCHETSLLVR